MLACLTIGLASAQTEMNLTCIEELTIPKYPAIALAARVQGEVITAVSINSEGKGTVTVEGPAMLKAAVKQQLDAARFDRYCSGRVVKLIFQFQLNGVAEDNGHPLQSTVFAAPNVYRIVSEAWHMIAD